MSKNPEPRPSLFAGLPITSLGTLTSRVLGLVREMVTANLLGLSGDGVMDAFVIAFRTPNLFRQLFGEGALAAAYLPVASSALGESREAAWRLASVTLFWLAVVLSALVMIGEGLCALAYWYFVSMPSIVEPAASGLYTTNAAASTALLAGLSAVMLPYLLFICLAAQVSATLHALSHFRAAALAPALLNVCWLGAAWLVAPRFAPDHRAQAYVIACAVTLAGVLQFVVQLPVLYGLGFRFQYDWPATRDRVRDVLRAMVPTAVGVAITQINTFLDSLMAWGLAAPTAGATIAWLPGEVRYPFEPGAAAAMYLGERLNQFPLGILGIAVATAVFPVFSRHAAAGDYDRLAEDLTAGLRLVLLLGLPAGAGLVLLAEPLAVLFFEGGEFTAADAERVARVIAAYGAGVWAFCAGPVVVRAFYALREQVTALRVGLVAVAVNVVLNWLLIWPLAEAGLALATGAAAMVQTGLLVAIFARRYRPLDWWSLATTAGRTLAATAVMVAAGVATLERLPTAEGKTEAGLRVAACIFICGAVFGLLQWALGGLKRRG
jgi:putative peptidoglycan lipid II flippase